MTKMNLEQLKKKLEPFIREIVRDEIKKNNNFDQTLENAKKSLQLFSEFGFFGKNKKKNELDGRDFEV